MAKWHSVSQIYLCEATKLYLRAREAISASPWSYIRERIKFVCILWTICSSRLMCLFFTPEVFVVQKPMFAPTLCAVCCGLGELTKCQIWHFDFQTARESLISEQGKGCFEKTKREKAKSLLHCAIAKSLQKFYAKICSVFLLFLLLFALFAESPKCCFRNHAWFPP